MKLLAALFASCFALTAQVIEGTVVDSVSGAPVAGASVQIGKAYSAISDGNGAFRIDGVAEGSYTALAFKDGFLTLQDEHARRPFRVAAGLDALHLTLSLIPRGRLTGHVIDAENRPVAGSEVRLLSSSGAGETVTTGQDGAFSFDVAPASYFLSGQPPAKLAPPPRVGDQDYAWAETWYPGVSRASEAQKILLRPGARLMDQDLKLLAVNAYKIRGQIRDNNGDPLSKVVVKLARAEKAAHAAERSTLTAADGSFEFPDAYDGDWRVSAERVIGDETLRTFSAVTISGRDADGLELRLSAPFGVPVQFLVVTPDATIPILSEVTLAPEWGGKAPGSKPNKEGEPILEGLYPGRYLVMPQSLSGYYLASISLGDQDIFGRMTEFTPNSPPLRIVYRSDGGTLRGTVEDCGNASIVVAPQDASLQRGDPYSVRFGRCSANGQFEIGNLRPGKYYAFAFATPSDRASFLAALPNLVNNAVSIEVQAKESVTAELKVSPAF